MSSWSSVGNTAVTPPDPSGFLQAEISGMTSFGTFALQNSATLPLNFISFDVKLKGSQFSKDVLLSWTTENEVNTESFIIERSSDGANFKSIGRTLSKNTPGTNNYSFNDYTPLPSTSYYRLKQLDRDGKFDYSIVSSINNTSELKLSIYPNPSSETINLVHPMADANAVIDIFDSTGKLVLSSTAAMGTGNLQMAGNIALSRIRLDYEPAYIFAFYANWDASTRSSKPEVTPADRAVLINHCGFLLASARPLELASQYQILLQSLFLRYQLLALLEEEDAMAITEKIIRDTLERYGLEALTEEFEDLLNNGIYHEHLFWDSQQLIIQAYEIAEQSDNETIEAKTPQDHNPLAGIVTKWSIEEPYPFQFPPISSYHTEPSK